MQTDTRQATSDVSSQKQFLLWLTWSGIALGLLHGCASTPDLSAGNPLPGIGLEAQGSSILLSWAPNSPIARQLRANARIQLVASYESERGNVSGEPLASVRVQANHSGVVLKLPNKLNNIAKGPVCFQLVQNYRTVPLRIARLGESSDGFYYDEWATRANQNRRLVNLELDKTRIDQNVANFRAGDPEFVKWRDQMGLSTRQDCSLLAANAGSVERPKNALQGASQVRAASEQCVALFNKLVTAPLDSLPALVELRPELSSEIFAQEIRSAVPERHRASADARQLESDVKSFGAGQDYFEVAELPLNVWSVESLWNTNDGILTEATAISLTEAYSGCLVETTDRLEQSYQAWLAGRDPSLRAKLNSAKQEECRARFDSFQRTEERLSHWLKQQAENTAEISALVSEDSKNLPGRKSLIPYACPLN